MYSESCQCLKTYQFKVVVVVEKYQHQVVVHRFKTFLLLLFYVQD